MKKLQRKTNQPFRIIQFTDLHLQNLESDARTLQLIEDLSRQHQVDFIILTGDNTMSKESPLLYRKLSRFMNMLQIPWTLVFGNHDTDHDVPYERLIEAIEPSDTCYFSNQTTKELGYGNHLIPIVNEQGISELLIVCLDSHRDQMVQVDDKLVWSYSTISESQVEWLEKSIELQKQANPRVNSLYFFHIPIQRFDESDHKRYLDGHRLEEASVALFDFGFTDFLQREKQALGCFVGHDHYNDYSFMDHHVLYAFGRVSGHYDYRQIPMIRGARLIDFDQGKMISTLVDWVR